MKDFTLQVLTAPLGKTHLFSVGQAGFIIKSKSGQLLAIDLYLSDCVERVEGNVGFKRLLPKILNPDDLEFDVIIATHYHRDHFDMDSVPEMLANENTRLFCPRDCEETIKNLEMKEDNITYVTPGSQMTAGDFTLHFIHCDHGTGAPQAVGVIVQVDGKTILEVGDTSLHLDWAEEYLSKGRLDVLIAPINGAYGNLNEQECVQLVQKLQPEITIPCHYGMFASHGGNPGLFYKMMKEKGLPLHLFTQGEELALK